MAEAVVLICDVCGKPAVQTITMKVDGRNLAKDVCDVHLAEITQGARVPRRGRRRAAVVAVTRSRPRARQSSGTKKRTVRRRAKKETR